MKRLYDVLASRKFAVSSIIALLAAIWGISGVHIVDAGERGIVLRFGKYQATAPPGLHWRAPWPIEAVSIVDIERVNIFEYKGRALTADENIVTVDLIVQYRRTDPSAYLFGMRNPDGLLQAASGSAIREAIGMNEIDYVVTEGRRSVAERTQAIIQASLDAHSAGIAVLEANLQDITFPSEVNASVQDVVMAREDRQRMRLEAETYANAIVPNARGEAARLRTEAEAYRSRTIAEAEGMADRFDRLLTEYRDAPTVTRERIYLEAIEAIFSNSNKAIVTANGVNRVIPLPVAAEDGGLLDDRSIGRETQVIENLTGGARQLER